LKVLIDTRSLQGAYHFGRLGKLADDDKYKEAKYSEGKRLKTFISIIQKETGFSPTPTKGDAKELQLPLLKEYNTLLILTRLFFLSLSELTDIKEFVRGGGNLLLMSNHPPFNEFDNPLAETFGFTFESPTYPWHRGGYGLTCIMGDNLNAHEITRNLEHGIIFNNSCRIRILKDHGYKVLATLPEEPGPNNIFALELDMKFGENSGRVIGVADSGFAGNDETKSPGPGQIGKGDNQKFIRNIFSWLRK